MGKSLKGFTQGFYSRVYSRVCYSRVGQFDKCHPPLFSNVSMVSEVSIVRVSKVSEVSIC